MDIVTKIITVIGGLISATAAIGMLLGVKDIRSGMSHEDPKTLDKGVTQLVVGGVTLLIVGGIVAYIIVQVNAIKF